MSRNEAVDDPHPTRSSAYSVRDDDQVPAAIEIGAGERRNRLGDFGELWFEQVCTLAGFSPASPRRDRGIDFLVDSPWGENIRVQVKTTEKPMRTADGNLSYPLDVATYDKLRQRCSTPSFLVVVAVHTPYPGWCGFMTAGTVVSATGYFLPMMGLPAVATTSTTSLSLPLRNMVTKDSVAAKMMPPALVAREE